MKKLTTIERRAVNLIVQENIRILFSRNRSGSRKNAGRVVPNRVVIEPGEARQMIQLNRFMAGAMSWMGKKLPPKSHERAQIRVRLVYLADANRLIRRMLERQPGRRAPLFITGKEAEMYFSNLDIVHRVFRAFRMNYIESATDMKKASDEAGEALWAIRSIINVGHLPAEKRSDRFGG